MPTNRMRVLYKDNKVKKVNVWNSEGKKYDATEVVLEVVGIAPESDVALRLRQINNSMHSDLQFTVSRKTLLLDIEAEAVDKIIAMGATDDGSPDSED